MHNKAPETTIFSGDSECVPAESFSTSSETPNQLEIDLLGSSELIRPSHQLAPYSIIKNKPELESYIPSSKIAPELQHAHERAASRAFEIVREYTSENTRLAHLGDLVYWQAWLSALGFSFTTPITEREVISFIVQHAEGLDADIDQKLVEQGFKLKPGPHKLSTIKRRVGSLSVFLVDAKWHNPCHNAEIKKLLSKLTKKYGTSRAAGRAITKDILDDMLATCGDKLIDLRDKAVLLFAWGTGGRRRSEVSSAIMDHLTRTSHNEFIYNIPSSKTDQEGKGAPVPVKGRVAKALNDWLAASGLMKGNVFRSISKNGAIGDKLSPIDIHRIVRRRLKAAGYDETQFGAHSLRSGFVTQAGMSGKPLGDVMAMTTHRSVNTAMRYYQSGNILNNPAGNLADNGEEQ
jgi:integrase